MACPQGKYQHTYQKGMLKVTECLTLQEILQIGKSKIFSDLVAGRVPQQDDYKGATISADTRTDYEKKEGARLGYEKAKQYAQDKGLKFNYQTGQVADVNDKTAKGSNWGTVSAPAIQQTAGSFSSVKDMNTATKGAGAIGGNWLAGASLVPLTMPAAGAIGSEIVNTARAIGPALNTPMRILGLTRPIPGLTGNNLLWGLGAAYSGNQIIDPNSETRQSINTAIQNPTLGNITDAAGYSLGTGLGFYGLPVRQGLSSLGDDLTNFGQYLTTGPLRNAYKYNPLAFKTQEGKIYRQVGKAGFDDAITEGKIFDKGQKQFLEANPEINYLDEYNEAINHSNSILKGLNLKKPSPAPFFSKDELFFPINRKATGTGNKKTKFSDAEYLFEGSVPEEALLPRYRDSYLKPTEATTNTFVLRPEYNDLSNFNLYKRHWLSGYKKVPSNFTISRDIAAKFKDLPEGINSKDLQNIIQKNLDWVKSEEYIQRRIATTGETREQVEKLTNKWISDLQNKTKYSIGSYNDEGGAYLQQFNPIFGRKSYITVNPEITPEKFLDIFEHEFIHGLSPALKSSASSLYKNYPVLNVNAPKTTLSKSLFGKYTDDEKHLRYLAEESEQQARAVRLNNRIRQDLDIKDFRKITESEFDQWLDKFYNPNAKDLANSGFADVVDLLDEAAAASKSTKNRPMLLDWLNKAWAVPGIGGVGILGTGALQQKKQGGQMQVR